MANTHRMNFPDVRHEMPFHSLHRAKILEMELCLCANLRARATNLLWQNNVFCQALRMQVAKKLQMTLPAHELVQIILRELNWGRENLFKLLAACWEQNRKFNLNFRFSHSNQVLIFHDLFISPIHCCCLFRDQLVLRAEFKRPKNIDSIKTIR